MMFNFVLLVAISMIKGKTSSFDKTAKNKLLSLDSIYSQTCLGTRLAKRREILIFPRTVGNTGNSREILVIPRNNSRELLGNRSLTY